MLLDVFFKSYETTISYSCRKPKPLKRNELLREQDDLRGGVTHRRKVEVVRCHRINPFKVSFFFIFISFSSSTHLSTLGISIDRMISSSFVRKEREGVKC
jgi:hypothetical protein